MCGKNQMKSQCSWEPADTDVTMPTVQQDSLALPVMTFENTGPFSDTPHDLLGMEAAVSVDGSDLLTVPSSFARDLADLQGTGRAEDWMDSFPLMPSNPTGPAAAMMQPGAEWDHSQTAVDNLLKVDWASPEMKRRRSAPASQKPSDSYMSAGSDALVPDWAPDPSNEIGFEYQPVRGGSLPKHGNQHLARRQARARNVGSKKPGLRRDHSSPASFPTSAMYHGGRLGPHGDEIPKQEVAYGMMGQDLSRLDAEKRAASRRLVYRIRSNALTSTKPAKVFGFDMPPPAKANVDPKTSSSNAFSEEHIQMNSSPEISSEQGQGNTKSSLSSEAPKLIKSTANENKSGPEQIAVDASKLTQFLAQIQTIQEKVNSLQSERQASQKRMDTIEESATKMSCLLKDLESLKAAGAPVGDREQRLELGSQELHSLLQAIQQPSG